jgi:hypothetical protein
MNGELTIFSSLADGVVFIKQISFLVLLPADGCYHKYQRLQNEKERDRKRWVNQGSRYSALFIHPFV